MQNQKLSGLNFNIIAAIFLGGGLGSALRYLISWLVNGLKINFTPLGTLSANIISCIIMAITLMVLSSRGDQSDWMRAFVLVGFCGGLSTFSTFSFETFTLLKSGQTGMAILNIAISVLMCLAIFYFFVKRV
ncbi:MAG: CrcB protein [Flavobacteriales bacterium]|jgi:CrcB protein